MHCPRCGTENFDGVRSCVSCGQVFVGSGTPGVAAAASPMDTRTCGLAIAALVLAILSPITCFLTAIPAIILGIIALVKIQGSGGTLKGMGMAITGIALPVVLLPVFALAMGIIMPALAKTRSLAFRMTCGTNMSGLGKAMLIYANDYDDKLPDPDKWCDLLIEYAEVTEMSLQCKGGQPGRCHYAMNDNAARMGADAPPDMVLLFETYPGWNQHGGLELLSTDNHYGRGCNILFVDGHVEWVSTRRLEELRW